AQVAHEAAVAQVSELGVGAHPPAPREAELERAADDAEERVAARREGRVPAERELVDGTEAAARDDERLDLIAALEHARAGAERKSDVARVDADDRLADRDLNVAAARAEGAIALIEAAGRGAEDAVRCERERHGRAPNDGGVEDRRDADLAVDAEIAGLV